MDPVAKRYGRADNVLPRRRAVCVVVCDIRRSVHSRLQTTLKRVVVGIDPETKY